MGDIGRTLPIGVEEGTPTGNQVALGDIMGHVAHGVVARLADSGFVHPGASIVEGAQHAGDIPQRAVLGASFFQRASGLSLEIDDVGIVVGHQHLAEMQIAMDSGEQTARCALRQRLDAGQQRLPLGQHPVGQPLVGFVGVTLVALQQVERLLDLLADTLGPGGHMRFVSQFRREVAVLARGRQYPMQLAQTPPQGRGEALEFVEGTVAALLDTNLALLTRLSNRPLQGVTRPRPGIALVGNEALHQHQGLRLTVGTASCHLAVERRHVFETLFAQVATELGLGMQARLQAPEQFEHHLVADDHRAVGLLGVAVGDVDVLGQFQLVQRRGRHKANLAVSARQVRPATQQVENAPSEGIHSQRIGQQADIAPATHPCQSQLLGHGATPVVFTEKAQWQQVAIATLRVLNLELAEQHGVQGILDAHRITDVYPVDARLLGGEPAPLGQIFGQRLVLHQAARWRIENFLQLTFDDQRDVIRHRLGCRYMPFGHRGLGRQQEPVEAVGRQCQLIRQLADRRKGAAADHLHRHLAGKRRQVELHRLGVARHVGHAQQHFALAIVEHQLAQVGENMPVGRIERLHGAAAEHAMLTAHRQQASHAVEQRVRVTRLGLDVDRLEAVQRIHDRR